MSSRRLLLAVADLMADPSAPNPEYDRACVEIVADYLGVGSDQRDAVTAILYALRDRVG